MYKSSQPAYGPEERMMVNVDKPPSSAHAVFVYGTLKKGHPNHRVLGESRFVMSGAVRGCQMAHLGGYPAIFRTPTDDTYTIHGEIYEVDDATLKALDSLEGVDGTVGLYTREYIFVPAYGRPCWAYFQKPPTGSWRRVIGGEWKGATQTATMVMHGRGPDASMGGNVYQVRPPENTRPALRVALKEATND